MTSYLFIALAFALSGAPPSSAQFSMSQQLTADRAHAEALGLKKSASADMKCSDRVNVESCLGTARAKGGSCAWCDGHCQGSEFKGEKCNELENADDRALCKSCRFRYTCSQWVQTQEDGGCDADETVVKWGDDDPKDYSSYRAFSGYNCKDGTCDTKDQCCYKTEKEERQTCSSNYGAKYCTNFKRLPKAGKTEIYCASSCKASECCDDTCAKPDWGYCRKGALKSMDERKTIRCMTPSKYGGKPDCSDEQCCDYPEERFSVAVFQNIQPGVMIFLVTAFVGAALTTSGIHTYRKKYWKVDLEKSLLDA